MLRLTAIITFALLSGCGSMYKSITGSGKITDAIVGFDDSRQVEVSPSILKPIEGNYGSSVHLGATWNSNNPNVVYLVFSQESSTSRLDTYINFYSASFNLDGEIRKFDMAGDTSHVATFQESIHGSIYTNSRNVLPVSIDYFEHLVSSENSKLRIETSSGNEDINLSYTTDSYGVEFSIVSLRRFNEAIQKYINP